MADNYLITGYWGEHHVTAENDRGIHAAIFGAGRFVLPVGEQFRAEYIGNNTVRIYDGKLLDNGAAAGIPAGKYIDLLIPEAGQGMKRNDLIIFQYSQDTSTLIETGVFKVLSGTETSGTAVDPALTQEDLLTDEATFDQMALWRVPVSAAVISEPVQLFTVSNNIKNASEPKVAATSTDGVNYIATVDGLDELSNGLGLTIIPNIDSTSESITLNVNGLGAKQIRIPISTNTALTTYPKEGFLCAGKPVKLMYDATYLNKGTWKTVGTQKTAVDDIYGSSFELLWKNASPTSAFAAQTITLDVSDYTFLAVVCYSESGIFTNVISTETGYKQRVSGSVPGNVSRYERDVTVKTDGIEFSSGYRFEFITDNNYSGETYAIPYKIYGIKG